jgi:hypothetical protein
MDTVFGDDAEDKNGAADVAAAPWSLGQSLDLETEVRKPVELWGFEPQTSSMPWTPGPSGWVALSRVSAVQSGSAVWLVLT